MHQFSIQILIKKSIKNRPEIDILGDLDPGPILVPILLHFGRVLELLSRPWAQHRRRKSSLKNDRENGLQKVMRGLQPMGLVSLKQ